MSNSTTRHTKLSVVALAMSAAFLLPGVAGAAEVCSDPMGDVESAISNADFLGKFGVRDENNMLNKHYQAIVKLRRGKFDDAIDKLINISDKAYGLATASPKPKLGDDSEISMAVNDAIACIAPPAP